MRNLGHLDKYRQEFRGDMGDETCGAFKLPIDGKTFTVVAVADAYGWDHVSVSHKNRIPTWEEMCKIKDLFFEDHEVVMQLHPAKENYVNIASNCLHLWRPTDKEIPTPPVWMV